MTVNHAKGCPCEPCRAQRADWAASWRSRQTGQDRQHGLVATYTNYRCRCDLCKAAKAEQQRIYREQRRLI